MKLTFIEIILLILCFIAIIAVIIFFLRKNNQIYSEENLIKNLEEQKEKNLKFLKQGDKEIDKLEKEILECRKKLNLKLYKK